MQLLFASFLVVTSAIASAFLVEWIVREIRKKRLFTATASAKEEFFHPQKSSSFFYNQKLRYAGLRERKKELSLLFLLVFALVGLALYLYLPHPGILIFAFLLTLFLFHQGIEYLIQKRTRRFNQALVTMISLMVRMIRNGIGLDQALERAISVNSDAFFKTIMQQFIHQRTTIGEEQAFKNLILSIDSKELRILALAIKIGKGTGGALSGTLEKLEKSLLDNEKLQRHIDAKTQETKIGSYLIIVLIATIFLVLDLTFNGDIHRYFFFTLKGKISFLIILAWVGIGIYINSVLTRIRP